MGQDTKKSTRSVSASSGRTNRPVVNNLPPPHETSAHQSRRKMIARTAPDQLPNDPNRPAGEKTPLLGSRQPHNSIDPNGFQPNPHRPGIWYSILTLNTAAVAIEPLFSYFLFVETMNAVLKMNEETAQVSRQYFVPSVVAIITLFTLSNLLGDLLADNITEDPYETINFFKQFLGYADSKHNTSSLVENKNTEPSHKRIVAERVVSLVILVLASFSFIALAGADAVAIAYLTDNQVARGITGVLTTLLGTVYYNMMSLQAIKKHVSAGFENLSKPLETLKETFKPRNLPYTIETLIKNEFGNSAYRGITGMFIAKQIGTQVLHLPETDTALKFFMMGTLVTTYFTTEFSRRLRVVEKFFDPMFKELELTPEEIKAASVSIWHILWDGLMTSLRAVPAAYLMNKFPLVDKPYQPYITVAGTALIASHSFLVRYRANKWIEAKNTKLEAKNKNSIDEGIPPLYTPQELVDKISELRSSPGFENFIALITFGGRLIRGVAFYGFIQSLVEFAGNNGYDISAFDPSVIMCAALIWGAPVAEGDYSFYYANILGTAAQLRTRLYLHRSEPISNSNAVSTFFQPLATYPRAYLVKHVDALEKAAKEQPPKRGIVDSILEALAKGRGYSLIPDAEAQRPASETFSLVN